MEAVQEQTISGIAVRIERALCIGSGSCVSVAPEVFELDEANVVAFREDVADIEPDRLVEACELCPVDALLAFDADGTQLVP